MSAVPGCFHLVASKLRGSVALSCTNRLDVRSLWFRSGRSGVVAGLAATAAELHLIRERLADDPIHRLEGAHPCGQKVPRLQNFGEHIRLPLLEHVDDEDEEQREEDKRGHHSKCRHASERHAEEEQRHEEEHEEEVGDSKPFVLRRRVAQELCGVDRNSAQRPDGIKDEDARNVEHQVRERDLKRKVELRGRGGERGKNASDSRADVGAENGRIHALNLDDADADERRDDRRRDRRRLDKNSEAEADGDGEVTGEPAQWDREAAALGVGDVGVDGAVKPDGDAPLQNGLERGDDSGQAGRTSRCKNRSPTKRPTKRPNKRPVPSRLLPKKRRRANQEVAVLAVVAVAVAVAVVVAAVAAAIVVAVAAAVVAAVVAAAAAAAAAASKERMELRRGGTTTVDLASFSRRMVARICSATSVRSRMETPCQKGQECSTTRFGTIARESTVQRT